MNPTIGIYCNKSYRYIYPMLGNMVRERFPRMTIWNSSSFITHQFRTLNIHLPATNDWENQNHFLLCLGTWTHHHLADQLRLTKRTLKKNTTVHKFLMSTNWVSHTPDKRPQDLSSPPSKSKNNAIRESKSNTICDGRV